MGDKTLLPVTAVILAGGENRRMAAYKALLKVGGMAMVEREVRALSQVFDEVIIVSGDPGAFSGLGLKVVPDADEFRGIKCPITGVYSGLSHIRNEYAFVVGCDMPFIVPALAGFLAGLRAGYDLVIPRRGDKVEPLFAVYAKAALPVIEAALLSGKRRLQDVFGELKVRYTGEDELRRHDPGLVSFMNVNTPADLARADDMASATKTPAGRP